MADPKKNPLIGAFHSSSPGGSSPDKPGEDKKTAEPPKEVKAPAAPAKPAEGEEKAPEGKAPTAPIKPDESKKPTGLSKDGKEQKNAEGEKKVAESKAPTTLTKADEGKKPAEPPKAIEDRKPDAKGKETEDSEVAATHDKVKNGEKPAEELDKDEIPKDFSMTIVPKDKLGQVIMMPMDYIDEFEGHPFPVRDNADMVALVDSIKQVGILEPATIIRNPKKPGRFEMVAGHRRMHGAKLAGLTEIPVIVRDMDHDEAIVYMVDSNLKREVPLTPMEKAKAYTMRTDAIKRKIGRRSKAEIAALGASGQKPMTADEEIAKQTGESVAQVQRFKTLTKLTEPLQKMVDDKTLPVNTAVDIAQMKPEEQDKLADAIEKEGGTVPSGTKAKELKEASKAGTLTPEKIEAAVAPTKREVDPPLKVTLNDEDLRPYFPKGTTVPDVKRVIFEALDLRKKAIERQKAKAVEKEPAKKSPAQAR